MKRWLALGSVSLLLFQACGRAAREPSGKPAAAVDSAAKLRSLTVSPGELSPAFEPQIRSYALVLQRNEREISIEARPREPTAKVWIAWQGGRTGTALALPMGSSRVGIGVDGGPGRQGFYEIRVIRSPWQKLGQGPFHPRDGSGLIWFKNWLWLLGGWQNFKPEFDGNNGYNDVWSSADAIHWTFVNRAPWGGAPPWGGRHCAGYAVFKNKMWVVSGDGHPDVWSSDDGVHWTLAVPNAPWGRRYSPYVVVFGDKLWLMGGISFWDGAGEFTMLDTPIAFNDVWNSSDGIHWTLVTAHAPWAPRGLIHGSLVFRGKCWLVGGGVKGRDTIAAYHDVWNTSDGVHWTKVIDDAPWKARTHFNVIVYSGEMWVVGGSVGRQTDFSNDVWHSGDGSDWRQLEGTPWAPTHATSLIVFNHRLLMVAGYFRNEIWDMSTAEDRTGEETRAGD